MENNKKEKLKFNASSRLKDNADRQTNGRTNIKNIPTNRHSYK